VRRPLEPLSAHRVITDILGLVEYGNPVSYLTLEAGTDVVSSDGDVVGKVEHVLADTENDIFDGESHGAEDSQSALESKLHRAWDLISGNY
jgi:hypothetical protein